LDSCVPNKFKLLLARYNLWHRPCQLSQFNGAIRN